MKIVHVSALVLGALALVGCGSETNQRPAEDPSDARTHQLQPASASERDDGQTANVAISEEIRRACGLDASEAHFAYNSARLQHKDDMTLSKVATCFIDGPLKGRQMLLVGRADPRGEEEYNMVLGERRAGSVQKALVGKRLSSKQIQTSSRGELDASGNDERGWAIDRRVDMLLGE